MSGRAKQVSCEDITSPTKILSGLYLNEGLSDVCFEVGEEQTEFHAQRVVLAIRSPVFKAMLFGGMKESLSSDNIIIEDVTAEAFSFILRFIYTGKSTNMSSENVVSILYAAEKYQLKDIVELCEKFVAQNLSEANVCGLYSQTIGIFPKVADKCYDFILKNADWIFSGSGARLYFFSVKCWEKILSGKLSVQSELKVFNNLLSWSKISTVNRQALPKLARMIRYVDMSSEEILDKVEGSNLFSGEEIVEILQCKLLNRTKKGSLLVNMRANVPGKPHKLELYEWTRDSLNKWLEQYGTNLWQEDMPNFNPERLKCLGSFYFLKYITSCYRRAIFQKFNNDFGKSVKLQSGIMVDFFQNDTCYQAGFGTVTDGRVTSVTFDRVTFISNNYNHINAIDVNNSEWICGCRGCSTDPNCGNQYC
eukprot:938082_1